LTRTDRWQNVRTAFAASGNAHGGSWLLVDDVLTTGSTAVAAAQALKETGAASVTLSVLSMART
jgi:predicted amidophosphoribosyltransferase